MQLKQEAGGGRVLSLDIFRGLTMLVMIFVNDLASVQGLPWWTYHMPHGVNGMTYVDAVFPSFLFIVGMAIPLAVRKRLEKGDSMPRLWGHILLRAASLIVLGLLLANAGKVDSRLTGIQPGLWGTLALVGAILLWNVYPKSDGRQVLYSILKYAGLVLLVAMFFIFRRTARDGHAAWLDFGYWEILGLIGRSYLAVCLLYIPLRRKPWAPMALLVGLIALNVASQLGWVGFLHRIPHAIWLFDAGELPSIAMAGVVASTIFLDSALARSFQAKALWALGYAAILLGAGWILSPLGVSKLAATPSWCLYCSGISVLLFLALYWLADVRRVTGWAAILKPAGSNTLLTYLLPDLFYFAVGSTVATWLWSSGWGGVLRSVIFTFAILGISGLLTRLRVRMQL
jgi:heparan-alpha-glucosaminide N-acetyltransferase